MKSGQIVLVISKSGFIQAAIRWFTGSQFSHSLVTIPDILSVPMGIEASVNGVDAVRFDSHYINASSQTYEMWDINVSQEIKDKAILSLLNDLEITYGFLQYPWFIWRRLCLFFGKDIKSQDNWNTSGMICSQVCYAFIVACLDLLDPSGATTAKVFFGYGKGAIAPADLKVIFAAHPELFSLSSTKGL